MPIEREDSGFRYWADAFPTPALGMDSGRLHQCIEETKRRNLKGVFGTRPFFRETNLDFLHDLPELTAVKFWDVTLTDLSGLYGLTHLEYLRLSGKRPPLEFNRLQCLQGLVWEYHKKDSGIDLLQHLEKLSLWRYKALPNGAFELKLPASLTDLGIYWSNVETLDGLACLPNLKKLELKRCRNLKRLGRLAESCPKLESLAVLASGKLTASEAKRAISGLANIRLVIAENKILLENRAS